MKRGEIYFANLDPTIGSEVKKKRPVLIISNDSNNSKSQTVTILPITSNIKNIFSFEVFLPASLSHLKKDSKIQCQQIRTISKLRITNSLIGKVDASTLHQIKLATELHLGFA